MKQTNTHTNTSQNYTENNVDKEVPNRKITYRWSSEITQKLKPVRAYSSLRNGKNWVASRMRTELLWRLRRRGHLRPFSFKLYWFGRKLWYVFVIICALLSSWSFVWANLRTHAHTSPVFPQPHFTFYPTLAKRVRSLRVLLHLDVPYTHAAMSDITYRVIVTPCHNTNA